RQVDRVVRGSVAHGRVAGPLPCRPQLPLRRRAGVLGAVRPLSLLEAEHREPGLRQPLGHDGAGDTGPDDEHVDRLGRHVDTLADVSHCPLTPWRMKRLAYPSNAAASVASKVAAGTVARLKKLRAIHSAACAALTAGATS